MDELVLDGVNGRRLVFSGFRFHDDPGHASYQAVMSLPEGEVTTEVFDPGSGLAAFFRELAEE
jgi:hypothetical protein